MGNGGFMSTAQQLIDKVKQLKICLMEQDRQLIVKALSNAWTIELKQAMIEHKSKKG